jgi:hypothetical protein
VFVVIRHLQVEIDWGAGVVVFRNYKPDSAGGRRCGPTALEAYRVPAPVVVTPMRKAMRIPVRHGSGLLLDGWKIPGHDFSRNS